jgi:hypothetical protein
MKKIGVLLLTLTVLSVKAQVKISGKAVDNKNRPVAGVSIVLKNSYDGATTDSSGNFTFNTFEKGVQVIEASSSGYKPFGCRYYNFCYIKRIDNGSKGCSNFCRIV